MGNKNDGERESERSGERKLLNTHINYQIHNTNINPVAMFRGRVIEPGNLMCPGGSLAHEDSHGQDITKLHPLFVMAQQILQKTCIGQRAGHMLGNPCGAQIVSHNVCTMFSCQTASMFKYSKVFNISAISLITNLTFTCALV